ncbi:MAG: hypothetical protein K2W96_08235 [Gemmataceae bacterium]|nr:hypothetical protein [Gemmataceae bacterium]
MAGWESSLDADGFDALAQSRPNAGPNVPQRWPEWDATERAEHEAEVAAVSCALGYEHRLR